LPAIYGEILVNGKQQTYYDLLGVIPGASAIEIRRAYRDLSKKYHPDTTSLPESIATAKFQALNHAYANLSHPERRAAYDLEIGYSRVFVVQPVSNFQTFTPRPDNYRSSAYLDPTDRPLSDGEISALLMLGLTFIGCIVLVIVIGIVRGELT
jgi:curved DNA-binding protein CbpA